MGMSLPKRIMIAGWGSRGDLQPITTLALALKNAGREVIVFATPPATDLFEANGIEHVVAKENIEVFIEQLFGQVDVSDRSLRGLMKLAKFGKEYLNDPDYVAIQREDMEAAFATARAFNPDLLVTPNLIYGPYVSIAEALEIPVVTMDLQINHPTSDYPLYTMEVGKFPKVLNRGFYWLKSKLYSRTIRPKFEMMREICGLPTDTYSNGTKFKIWPHDLPQMCAVSPSLFPEPSDWPSQKHISGWLFMPDSSSYRPPEGLLDFLEHKPVYIGFGSMKGNPEFCQKLSTFAIKGLKLSGKKGLLLGGWAGLTMESLDRSTGEGQDLYEWAQENVFEVPSCPHEWLFPKCCAVVHHGGAGTLAAGLRAGRPTVVCAMQGDQPFHGSIVRRHGVGQYLGFVGAPKTNAESLAAAIKDITSDTAVMSSVSELARQINKEEGAAEAIRFIDQMAGSFQYPWPLKVNKPYSH